MRTLLRFLVAVVLIASCSDGLPTGVTDTWEPPPPEPICLPPDSVFDIVRDSVRVPVGARAYAPLVWYDQNCYDYASYPPWTADWDSSDSAVAMVVLEYQSVNVEALRPGRATIRASSDDRSDSMLVVVPDTVAMGRIVSIAAGSDATCAVDEAGVTYCWGGGSVATTEDGLCYEAVCTMPIERTTGAAGVRIGPRESCVLDAGGTARCWGSGDRSEPSHVDGGIAFSDLAISEQHTCGLGTDANIYCWGYGQGGELGTGLQETVHQPKAVAGGHRFVSVSAWTHTSCGVTEEGALLCWGYLAEDGVTIPGASRCSMTYQDKSGPVTYYVTCSLSPLRMPIAPQGSDTIFVAVSKGCGLTEQGSVYCRKGTRLERLAPPGSFVTIASGEGHACGLDASGSAKCWGEGYLGQRGDGTQLFSSAPVTVAGGHAFTEIAAGAWHTCGLALAGDVWCWGANEHGQAGVPMRSDTRVPQRVRGQP